MNKLIPQPPIGKVFTDVARAYFGMLAERLEHTGFDRFFYPLVVIHDGGGSLTQQKLADILKTDKVTTVRVIDYLSKKGLVKREVNSNDRREHLLTLTPKALKIMPDISNALKDVEKELFTGVSTGQREEFRSCLEMIMGNISKIPSERIKVKVKFDKIKKGNK